MQTTEHQRVPTLPKQRIATLLGEINVHLVGNGPAMVCWPSLMMTGQMLAGTGRPFRKQPSDGSVDPPGHGESESLNGTSPLRNVPYV